MTAQTNPSKNLLSLLQKAALFKDLSSEELDSVIASAYWIKQEQDAFFFMEEDPAQVIYLLTKGKIKLSQVTPDGPQVLLGYISPGTEFGLLAVLNQTTYPISAQAVGVCEALAWNRDAFDQLLKKSHQITLNAMSILVGHIRDYQRQIQDLATQRVERRIARLLLRLAQQSGYKSDQGVVIDLPLTRQDIAEMTGTTLFTVSRTLKQWEKQGLILSKRGQVIIRFPHGVVKIADEFISAE
jgi:CRP-like cAMP-binding protein